MQDINIIIGKNLALLRKKHKLTQLELAEKLNYSDKAVSKWEKGDSIPSVEVLLNIAKFYEVTLDDLVNPDIKIVESNIQNSKYVKRNKVIITLLAVALVFMICTVLFVCGQLINNQGNWILFIWAVPVSMIVALVFNSVWGKSKFNYLILTVFIWTLLLGFYLEFIEYELYPLFFLGIPGQIILMLWFGLHPKNKAKTDKKFNDKNKKNQTES